MAVSTQFLLQQNLLTINKLTDYRLVGPEPGVNMNLLLIRAFRNLFFPVLTFFMVTQSNYCAMASENGTEAIGQRFGTYYDTNEEMPVICLLQNDACYVMRVLAKASTKGIDTSGGRNPGAVICRNVCGKVAIDRDESGNEQSFCFFSDGSFVGSGSLYEHALKNDIRNSGSLQSEELTPCPQNDEPVKQIPSLDIPTIYFDSGSVQIRPEFLPSLQQLAVLLKKYPALKIKMRGHGDERGGALAAIQIGDKRIASVTAQLIALGVVKSQLTGVSFGKELPQDPSHTIAAWAKNRRVEIFIELSRENEK